MIEIGLGGFIGVIALSFIIGGGIGITLVCCLAAGRSDDSNDDK